MNYTHIKYLTEGQTVDQIFLVRDVSSHITKTKEPFLILTLSDVTGTIKASVWNCKYEDVKSFVTPGKYIRLSGEVKLYKSETVISSRNHIIGPYNGDPPNLEDYIGGINQAEIDVFTGQIKERINQIDDPHYRDLIQSSMSTIDILGLLAKSPLGFNGPFAIRGGLLVFTANTLEFCHAIKSNINQIIFEDGINNSLLTLTSVFKNIGWATTTDFKDKHIIRNDSFDLFGPELATFRFIDHLLLNTDSIFKENHIPENKKRALQNSCLKNPQTVEGKIISSCEEIVFNLHHANFASRYLNQDSNWLKTDPPIFRGHLNVRQ